MRYHILFTAFIVVLAGCATRSDISVSHNADTVAFSHEESGRSVVVTVSRPYVFKDLVERKYNGVVFEGYFFESENQSSIMVTKLPHADFEKLAGVTMGDQVSGIKPYPPVTIFEAKYCELVRAYVVSFEKEVIAVVGVRGLAAKKEPCEGLASLDDIKLTHMDELRRFNKSVDTAIRIVRGD